MDTITTAIIAALANMSNDIIKDSYNALKTALKKVFGSESELVEAVEKLESKPDSEGRKATLQEEIANAKASDNSEIAQLAQSLQNLLDKIKEQAGEHQATTIRQAVELHDNAKVDKLNSIAEIKAKNVTL